MLQKVKTRLGIFNLSKLGVLALFFVCINLFSCDENKKASVTKSTGKINSLSIVISDQLWNGEVGDSLRKKFAAPVDGLTQEEPLFTITQLPVKILEGYKTISRNVIIIKREEKNYYKFEKNEFAKPQNVVHISGNNVGEIIEHIEKNGDSIVDLFKQTEILKSQEIINASLLDDKKIQDKFKISLKIPSTYKYVLQKRNFIWVKKEILSGNTSVVIYKVPFRTILKNDDIVTNIIEMRDSFGGKYIKGKKPNTKMITEESYSPYFMNMILDNKRTYETKGTWELKGDFMSGSFINYAIMNREKREFVVIEGFCYAPSNDKRDLMHELEAIIKSVKFIK
ncbi:hypothetical protein J2X31_003191 [Flavobacterium arsenatis]|uniref:DUF4837 family protein n=1 Tax=Flavobacterium arsenatis TaxID=1484332 RepID=A0ABU1TTF6_9FLAO|nr:DUF4837 family protein [Flavobacterium arsenatis]MDR6969164.1 hypothetical protein [Flavobacterium arsenatis]